METFLKVLGVIIVILSVCAGLYLGIWLLFIGGIMQIVNGISPVNGVEIAWGIIRIIFASPVGVGVGIVGTLLGMFVIAIGDDMD